MEAMKRHDEAKAIHDKKYNGAGTKMVKLRPRPPLCPGSPASASTRLSRLCLVPCGAARHLLSCPKRSLKFPGETRPP